MEDGSTVSTRSVQARAELAARTVLLVEDDPALRTVVKLTLEAAGMEVTTAADGETALTKARTGEFAIVLLDLMLPALDGLEVCRRIRETSHVPIIVITALDSTGDVVSGLEAGADDYMTKPFEGPELVARIRALLRRSDPQSDEIRRVGDLEIDAAAHRLYKAGREVNLSAMEFRLLLVLSENVGHV